MRKLDALYESLKKNSLALYNSHEKNEILLHLYSTIHLGFLMKADTLVLEPMQFFYFDKDGKMLYPFRQDILELQQQLAMDSDAEHVSNLEMLDLMMERDQVVRDCLAVISKSPEKAIYKLKYP